MKFVDLCGAWRGECIFSNQERLEFTADVPGSTIKDLINSGYLPSDLFWRDNADEVLKFEGCSYIYKKSFEFSGECKNALIRFERIDTYADVFLNGVKIYHSENGNIRHDIDVSGRLAQGNNDLEVCLYSPSEWVKDKPLRRGAFTQERMNTRRMQCTYGWDWVARFLCCGIGDCTLLIPEDVELPDVYIATLESDSESATVRVDITFPYEYEGRVLEFLIFDPYGDVVYRFLKYCDEALVRLDCDIQAPRLWYPLGYGDQPIYTFIIKDGENPICAESFGIRTVKIMQIKDKPGDKNHQLCLSIKNKEYDFNSEFSGFVVKINGERVFCKGANWVPCLPYATGNIDERQTEILELCAEAGVNMLRVWGGGAFETRHFYDECSRLGIMVTQDFLMACGAYPEEEEWFIEELQREALYAARLCRNQPCLVWWSGDNENAVKGSDLDADYRGRRSAYKGIAPVIYREDPYRRFLPSSPFGGNMYASNTVGTTHNTQYLGQLLEYIENGDLSEYKEEFKKYRARFIAEEPQLGAVSLPTLRRFMTDEDIFDNEKMWRYHTKSNPRLAKELFDYLCQMTEGVLGRFSDPHDKLFKLQYMQYEWLRVVMEQARRERELCSGIVFWMMNDCWPAASGWSLIDFYNIPKNAFYSFKRCAKPIIASVDFDGGVYRVYAINDGEKVEITLSVKILSADRRSIRECGAFEHLIPKYSATVVFEGEELLKDGEVLIADVEGAFGRDRAFYRHGGLEIAPVDIDFDIDSENCEITLSAKDKYVHAVTASGNAVFDDNCFSLLPYEARTVSYRPSADGLPIDISVKAYTLV